MIPGRITRQLTTTATLMAASLLPAANLQAQTASDLIPEKAHMALIVPGMDLIDQRVNDLKQAFPMIPVDDFMEGMDEFRDMIGPAYDGTKPALMVIPNVMTLPMSAQTGQPAMVILAPISDYTAFVERHGGSANDDITQIFPPDGPPAFARHIGGYAAISMNERTLKNYTPGETDSPMQGQSNAELTSMATGDSACFYVNLEDLGPAVLPLVEMGADTMIAQAEMQLSMSDMDDDAIDAQIGNMRLAIASFKAMLRDGKSFMIGIDLAADSAAINMGMQLRDGSPMADYFPGKANLSGSLGMLPSDKAVASMNFDGRAVRIGKMLETMMDVAPELARTYPGKEHWMPIYEDMGRYAYNIYAPDMMGGGGLVRAIARVEATDPAEMKEHMVQAITSFDGHTIPAGMSGEMISYKTTHRANAGQSEGISYDQFSLSTNFPPEVMEQLGPMAGFVSMLSNQNGYIAADDKSILVTTVPDEALLSEAIKAGRNKAADPAMVTASRKNLPSNLAMEFFFYPQGLGEIANVLGPMAGLQPIAVPADLPPISGGLGIENNGLLFRYHVPYETVSFIVDEAQKAMGGGMGDLDMSEPQEIPQAPF